jgi:hypothetical protein
MVSDAPAKIYSDQKNLPIYLGDSGDGFTLPGKEKWRAPEAIAAVTGVLGTATMVTLGLDGGHALTLLILGLALTVAAVWLLGKLPVHRPSLATRAVWLWHNTLPRVSGSHPASRQHGR